MYVANYISDTVSVIATTPTPIQPPTQTTIVSATDGSGNPVQNESSTVSTSITFEVKATPGANPIAGFECSLDDSPFSSCASTTTNSGTISYDNLAAGQQHSFEVRAVDTLGNKDPTPATSDYTYTIRSSTEYYKYNKQYASFAWHDNKPGSSIKRCSKSIES